MKRRKKTPPTVSGTKAYKSVKKTAKKILKKIKIAGIGYQQESCHLSKSAADKVAKGIRKAGYTARVVTNSSNRVCVYKGPRKKAQVKRGR